MTTIVSISREERRADRMIAKIKKATDNAGLIIINNLYEDTRPRSIEYKGVVLIQTASQYEMLVRPFQTESWGQLLEWFDQRGVVNPRVIAVRSKRLAIIASQLERLMSEGVIERDIDAGTVWLSYDTYQEEATKDAERRDERERRRQLRFG